ncbi:MAG: Protein of unknown function (DUF1553)/Protein of unknown function (DUF1549)/Planctomycete [Verrucomicrobiales bacterium]|nr:Protein of unknown function (DUF1553)/Protein of unknown function (DUF1549)/Planctomycete [Verrucomicrobiales bacterium]
MPMSCRKILCLLMFAALANPVLAVNSTNKLSFNRDIRPILSENCFRCHGPDKGNRKAKMRLDDRDSAIEKGAIKPGKPEESELISRINSTKEDEMMPPPDTHKHLKQKEKDLLKEWIAQGAEYEPHWAYILPVRPPLASVSNKKWVKNPIDTFILHSLEAKKIKPSSQADKRTLLRRLSLDLIGLPPTLEELNTFLNDKSPKAYERQVDRLLSSPHFGERMAAPWLDAVRFADTVGYHGDQNQNCFPYRDYVIDSFNKNKRFDQFTIEQLAGDLLPNPTDEQWAATCFNRLNMMTREGGAQPKEYISKYQADRARTISGAWLGSTMGCAECHDHKYDPFWAKDFYAMEAFFADVKQWGVYADYGYTPNPDLKGYGNDHPFAPEKEVANSYLQQRRTNLLADVSKIASMAGARFKTNATDRKAFEKWSRTAGAFLKQHPTGWLTPQPVVAFKRKDTNATENASAIVQRDNVVLLGNDAKENIQLSLSLSNTSISAIRLEITPQEEATIGKGKKLRKGTSLTLAATLKTNGGEAKLSFFYADADYKEPRYSMGVPNLGVKDAWPISPQHDSQTAVWILEKPLVISGSNTLVLNLGNAALVSVRASVSPFAAIEPLNAGGGEPLRKALSQSTSRRSVVDRDLVNVTYLLSSSGNDTSVAALRKVAPEIWACRGGRTMTMITEAREPITTRILPRGNWQDESGEVVLPSVPHFLPQPENPEKRRLTRLDLAKWLVSKQNPLTARAIVNRFWKQYFGTGISAIVDDLGGQGEWPVHPELLDWLAVEFQESGWDVKHMVKLIVMSSTYQQESNLRPSLKDIDPNNRLVSCQSPRRLEAEFVRDNALAISGLLNPDIGGPSAHPYQPAGFYSNIQFPERDYHPDKDSQQYRRGVYTWWQRTFLHPMMSNFDAPSREESVCTRNLSNTPQQGLTLLNDPTFVEAARVLAEKILVNKKLTDEQRINAAYERALARPAKPTERDSLNQFLTEQRQHYREHADEAEKLLNVGLTTTAHNADKSEVASWTQVCRVILNLHETITKY